MKNYVFVCIGTNLLIEDSFGPRVGDILIRKFDKNPNVEVLGTMKCPVHFLNAPIFLDYLKNEQANIILIDSALGESKDIGTIYLNRGGTEIGKAFGKSFYFPANFSIKTVIGTLNREGNDLKHNNKCEKWKRIREINGLAQKVAGQITHECY